MGYVFDIMESYEDKIKKQKKLISIMRKLNPDLLQQARRIAKGIEKMPRKPKVNECG